MSILEVPLPKGKEEVRKQEFSMEDLDLSPLFVEPPATGVFEKFIPWINMGLSVLLIVLLVVLRK